MKTDINELPSALPLINKLRPVTFHYKQGVTVPQENMPSEIKPAKYNFPTTTQVGFVAQDLDSALAGTIFHDGIVHSPETKNGYMSISESNLLPILTKAIQEMSARLDADEATIQELKSKLGEQKK